MLRTTHYVKFILNGNVLLAWLLSVLIAYSVVVNASVNYNSVYNKAINPELKHAIQKDLPKEAKFFDELDCK